MKQFAVDAETGEELDTIQIPVRELEELKAHINSLREALGYVKYFYGLESDVIDEALLTTPAQSLAEHGKKVIAEFRAKCEVSMYARLVNGEIDWSENCVSKYKGYTIDSYENDEFNTYTEIKLYTLPPIDNEEK